MYDAEKMGKMHKYIINIIQIKTAAQQINANRQN